MANGTGSNNPQVHNICKLFSMSDEQMKEVCTRMLKEIQMGLARDTHPRSVIKCFITYVQDLPTGKERGKYLALDIGGTNFRVLMVTIKSENDVQMESKSYILPEALIIGTGKDLFDYIAECLANFMKDMRVEKESMPLGFTFSFPCVQMGLAKAMLVTWTKGFNCEGVVGKDVCQLLQEAIERRGDVKINIVAVLNDTTGTLMACAWKHRNCRIGLIVGTGCNACYVEKVKATEMFEGSNNGKQNMIINCEWGAFGDNGVLDFIRTEYDKVVDKQTFNAGKQLFEKCISGMYLGELVRLIILKLVEDGVLFKGQQSDVLLKKWKFETKFISEIEADAPGSYNNCRLVLDRFGLRSVTDEECANVRHICETISTRSAKLVSCGLATLINKMDEPNVTVGIDGGVYHFHPKYHNLLIENMKKMVNPKIKFDLVLSEDGSGRGAALIAAVAAQH